MRILDFIITESGKFGYEYLQCNTVRGGVTSVEEILFNSRSRSRKRYYMLQKEFHLEEFEN